MGGCTSTSNLCIVTEYLANGSLFDYIGDPTRPRFTWTQTVKVASEIARGMAFLHNNSPPIIHRDLKVGGLGRGDGRRQKGGVAWLLWVV